MGTGKMEPLFCLFLGMCLLAGCVPVAQSGAGSTSAANTDYARTKMLVLEDKIYEPDTRTVLFYANTGKEADVLEPPTISLGTGNVLRLEWDEMGNTYHNYYYKILPCTWDWKPGILQDMEITEQYNEFVMDGYELSSGTRVPFVHYFANVPRVKLSGNYVLMVYREGKKEDVVITRRFVVFENQVGIAPEVKFAAGVGERFTRQQVDFNISYGQFPAINPVQSMKVVVRQNGRWDNAIVGLAPFFVRDLERTLDYHLVDLTNTFAGGNEWRSFDIRSIRFKRFGVNDLKFDNNRADAWLNLDGSRNLRNYSFFIDANGRFAIGKAEAEDGNITADYVFTHFYLKPPADMGDKDVYVFGALSDWRLDPAFRLRPDSANAGVLTTTVPLKQGYYNYGYATMPRGSTAQPDLTELEGTYNLTENYYDILVYYKQIGARYDQLIGYTRVAYNPAQRNRR